MLTAYAELLCRSHFNFLTGASSPEELVERAAALRYAALAITDECSLSGVVHAYERATELGLPLIVGTEMRLEASIGGMPMRLVLLATTRRGYGNLSQWITLARRRAPKGRYDARVGDIEGKVPTLPNLTGLPDCLALLLPTTGPVQIGATDELAAEEARRWASEEEDVDFPEAGGEGAKPGSGRRRDRDFVSSQSVIALAQARAAASMATNSPRSDRSRTRAAREQRDGPATADPSDAGTAPRATVDKTPPLPTFVARPSTVLPLGSLISQAEWVRNWFGHGRAWLAIPMLGQGEDDEIRERVKAVARETGLRIAAVGDVLMATHSAKPLQDVLTATRLQRTLLESGHLLSPNAEAHLRPRSRLGMLFDERWMAETVVIANLCEFSLGELKYKYPDEIVPPGHTPTSWLRALTERGARERFPDGVPEKTRRLIEHELALIARKSYEAYFLTVADIVRWARQQRILCQGRGSAANSAVCYCLNVTEVNPDRIDVLFERFISEERDEPPDIDIDFEHQRREEVIQYIYRKYGRHRTALTGVVIRYRLKSAVRDVGRALGVDLDRIQAVTSTLHHVGGASAPAGPVERLALALTEHGFDPESQLGRNWIELSLKLRNQPRHLSQHPGGFVIARDELAKLVPVENATMEDRTVIQWDKDDLDVLGLLKVDILALGMLSALKRALVFVEQKSRMERKFAQGEGPAQIRRLAQVDANGQAEIPEQSEGATALDAETSASSPSFKLFRTEYQVGCETEEASAALAEARDKVVPSDSELTLGRIPQHDDEAVYAMLSAGESIGVFQVESRAQMSMLPRLRPRTYYDLVVQVAIVRPGPIQGGMVHPYLQRRQKKEPVDYPSPEVEHVLKRTEGVPIFQEQVMQLAMVAADFTPSEADQLRRAMAAWKRKGGLESFEKKLINNMTAKGYKPEYAEAIFRQIRGFGEYGFPESHAASFALLVYSSAWIKRYHPDAFLAALLNSLPMGFYAAPQLVRDARAHGVAVRPVDVTVSDWDSTLELPRPNEVVPACPERFIPSGQCAVRLGLGRVQGLDEEEGLRIERARAQAPFADVEDLSRRAGLDDRAMHCLAAADALVALTGQRREALWAVAGVDTRSTPLLKPTRTAEGTSPDLDPLGLADSVLADYRALGLSLKSHPLALLRSTLASSRVAQAARLNAHWRNGQPARACGLVTHRQQPGTAKGVVFVTLEDETGVVNVIVWPAVAAAQRRPLLSASLMMVTGVWQCQGEVRHLIAGKIVDQSPLLQGLATKSRDFH